MPSTLVFPDGVRLAERHELPGPESERAQVLSSIQQAEIAPGFVLADSLDRSFAFYSEANVDAPKIWDVFRDLSQSLLGPFATLVISEIDRELVPVGAADTGKILRLLEPHAYQLANDGLIQFGLLAKTVDTITEVFVAPTKHFMVWLNEEARFRSVMEAYAIPEVESLQFIDEFPRTTTPLSAEKTSFVDHDSLIEHFETQLAGIS